MLCVKNDFDSPPVDGSEGMKTPVGRASKRMRKRFPGVEINKISLKEPIFLKKLGDIS